MKKTCSGLLAMMLALPVWAEDVDNLSGLSQTQFRGLSEDMASVVSYKVARPAEPMGLTGFDFGLSLSAVKLEHQDAWKIAMSTDKNEDTLLVPRLVFQKGLPWDIDVGLYYFSPPQSNIESWGGEIKYALYDGSILMPAVAVRATSAEMFGVNDLAYDTKGVDLSISKGFLIFTPYLGIGRTKVDSTPQGAIGAVLSKESFSDMHHYMGVVVSPGLFSLTLEYDVLGDVDAYTLKFGMGF